MKRKSRARQLSVEALENRFCLDGMPLLWMEDNNFGIASGLPPDFVKRFQDPETWQVALRTIDTLYLRETSLGTISNSILQDTIAPVLNAAQANVAIDSTAANFLTRRVRERASSYDIELDSHFRWLDGLIAAGLRVRTVSLQSVLSLTSTSDRSWEQYSLNDRISDVVEYSSRLVSRYPWMRVGIIDSTPTDNRQYTSIYQSLAVSMSNRQLSLDHIHLDMPVDFVGDGKAFSWDNVFQIQRFVQVTINTKFGLMLTSIEGGDFSSDRWATRSISGLSAYQDAIRRIANFNSQPDRVIITSRHANPIASVPESLPEPTIEGMAGVRLRNTTQVIVQATNLLRGYPDFNPNRLQLELTQVPPITASASSTAIGNDRSAEHAVFGRGVLDATESLERFQWQATSTDSTPWIKAGLSKVTGISQIRLWPFRGTGNTGGAIAEVYASSTGTGNPVSNPNDWRLMTSVDLRNASDAYVEAPFNLVQASSVLVRFREITGTAGLAAMRIYAPVPGWNAPYQSPLEPRIPKVEIQLEHVLSGQLGAKIATLAVGGINATNNYRLSLDDTRFELRSNQLYLRSNTSLNIAVTPGVAVWVTFQDKLNSSRTFSKLVSFLVYPVGSSPSSFDYGDAPDSFPVTKAKNGARHGATGPMLGRTRNVEADGVPSNNASSSTDDDGVAFLGLKAGSSQAKMEVNVSGATPRAIIEAWIDFNGDGSWNSAEERIVSNWAVFNGLTTIPFSVPSAARSGATYARVRISSGSTQSPKGTAADGEVEDYQITISPADFNTSTFISHSIATSLDGPRSIEPVDFDRDGDVDLITATELTRSVSLLINEGNQQFRSVWSGYADFVTSAIAVDFDGDGDFDILAAAYGNESLPGVGNELILFRNVGLFQFERFVIAPGLVGVHSVSAVDMDGDGDMDALVPAYRANRYYWIENLGTRGFQTHEIAAAVLATSIKAADVDRDGDQDLLLTSEELDGVFLYRNNGSQGFTGEAITRNLDMARDAVFADFDGDGDLDIAASGRAIQWFEQTSNGFVQRSQNQSANLVHQLQAVDLDGDGMMDLLASHALENKIFWHRNLGGMQFEPKVLAENLGWVVFAAAADMDRDGDLDILSANWQADNYVWLEQTGIDRGDAPASFALAGQATHSMSSLYLGSRVDADETDQSSPNADSDDRDLDGDDDDGAHFLSTLRSTIAPYTSSIFVSASEAGYLDAWVDFNGNGRFDHPLEQLFDGSSLPVARGGNYISFSVPAGIHTGIVTARFRISSSGRLQPTGAVTGGEVEDYNILVEPQTVFAHWCSSLPIDFSSVVQIYMNASESSVRTGETLLHQSSGVDPGRIEVDGNEHDNVFELVEYLTGKALAIRGGEGTDTLKIMGQNSLFELSQNYPANLSSIERIDLRNGQQQAIEIGLDAIATNQPEASRSLVIVSDALDSVRFAQGWQMQSPVFLAGELTHRMVYASEFLAVQNRLPWSNPIEPLDVNADNDVNPLDILEVINLLNSRGTLLAPDEQSDLDNWRYYDSDRSGSVDPLDVLLIVNAINRRG